MCIRDRAGVDRPAFQLIEQLNERLQFKVALAGTPQVGHHARHVLKVGILAVAITKAGEDAEHLDLALRTHPFVIAVEVVEIRMHRQACLACPVPVTNDKIELLFLVPVDVGVAVERDKVVGCLLYTSRCV